MIDFGCKDNTNIGDGLRFSEKTLILQHEIFKINYYAKIHEGYSSNNANNDNECFYWMQ